MSDLGRMRSLKFNPPRIIGKSATSHGYLQVGLTRLGEKKCKVYRVHRLVLEAFVGPCPPGMEALHGPDPDRANARLDNLCWGTPARNQNERARDHTTNRGENCGSAKHTWEQICEIRRRAAAGEAGTKLAKEFNLDVSATYKVIRGERWAYPPEEW